MVKEHAANVRIMAGVLFIYDDLLNLVHEGL